MEVSKAHADGYDEGDQDTFVEDAAALHLHILAIQSSGMGSCFSLLLLLAVIFLILLLFLTLA